MEIKYRCLLRKKNCFNFLLFLLQQIIIMYVCATIEIWCWQLAQCAIDVSFVYFSLQLLLFWLDRMMIACKYLITKNYLSRMCLVIYDTWTKFNRTICSTFFFLFFSVDIAELIIGTRNVAKREKNVHWYCVEWKKVIKHINLEIVFL